MDRVDRDREEKVIDNRDRNRDGYRDRNDRGSHRDREETVTMIEIEIGIEI